ncbi:hypothetical protein FB451DRAFT_977322, partial [Mycena latifolia]
GDSVPMWVADARKALRDGEGGESWDRVVELWWAVEEKGAFQGPGKGVAAKIRPAQVGGWIQRARTGGPSPAVKDLYAFTVQWWKWWVAMNPGWRARIDGGKRLEKGGEGEWGSVAQTGPNGLLNVLICLRWWRDELRQGDAATEWAEAVDDVRWVLE